MNQEILKDRFLYPMTEPDGQGKQRKLGIEPNIFKNSDECEGLVFKYSFAQGEGLYFVAIQTVFLAVMKGLEDLLRTKEPTPPLIWEYQPNPQKPAVKLAVGRGDDLRPFLAISGEINGKVRSKRFYWYLPKGYSLVRNGNPVSDLEGAETMMRSFIGCTDLFLRVLEDSYKARVFQQGGGNRGGGGGNQNYRAPAGGDAQFDDLF